VGHFGRQKMLNILKDLILTETVQICVWKTNGDGVKK